MRAAGVIVLESAEHAAKRGAKVYCEALGQGLSADSHHIAQPEPSGRGIAAAMEQLLAATDIKPAEIAHLNAHATSTPRVTSPRSRRCARSSATTWTTWPSRPPSP